MIMSALKIFRGMSFSKVSDIETRIFYYLCGFSFFLPLSKPAGNIFLVLSLLGMFHRLFYKNDDVKIIFREYRKIFSTIIFLLATVFISALTSADILYGIKKFLEKYILHISAIFPVLLVCDRERILKLVKLLLLGTFLSNLMVVAQGFLHLNKKWRFGGLLPAMTQGTLIATCLPLYALLIMKLEHKKFLIVASVVGILALIFNGTRGVWLTVAILIPAVVLIYARNKLKAFAAVAVIFAIIGGIFAATPNLHKRFLTITNINDRSNYERLLMWQSAWNMFKDYPVFGVGYGQYRFAYQQKYISPEAKEKWQVHAHNNVVQMLAECGFVGAAAFIFMWGYFSYFCLRAWFKEKNFSWLLFFCVLWAMMLHGLTEFNFETSVTSKMFWYALGLCIVYNQIEKTARREFLT